MDVGVEWRRSATRPGAFEQRSNRAAYARAADRSVILRCTKKLLAVIGPKLVAEPAPAPDAEDWYANLLWLDRRKCLLLTHSATLFSVFEADARAADLRATGRLVTGLIGRELLSEGLPSATFDGPGAGEDYSRQDGRPQRTGMHERHGVPVRERDQRIL